MENKYILVWKCKFHGFICEYRIDDISDCCYLCLSERKFNRCEKVKIEISTNIPSDNLNIEEKVELHGKSLDLMMESYADMEQRVDGLEKLTKLLHMLDDMKCDNISKIEEKIEEKIKDRIKELNDYINIWKTCGAGISDRVVELEKRMESHSYCIEELHQENKDQECRLDNLEEKLDKIDKLTSRLEMFMMNKG